MKTTWRGYSPLHGSAPAISDQGRFPPLTKPYSRERQGVEIDYCRQCRDVRLDRSELDKIIERGSIAASPPVPNNPPLREQQGYAQPQGYSKHGHPKRKKSFFEELFD